MCACIYGDDDNVVWGDVLSFQHALDDLWGFGKCSLGEEWVEHTISVAWLYTLVVDHFQVAIDNLIIQPRANTKRPEGPGGEFLQEIQPQLLYNMIWSPFAHRP